jgi:hypothetical protein
VAAFQQFGLGGATPLLVLCISGTGWHQTGEGCSGLREDRSLSGFYGGAGSGGDTAAKREALDGRSEVWGVGVSLDMHLPGQPSQMLWVYACRDGSI